MLTNLYTLTSITNCVLILWFVFIKMFPEAQIMEKLNFEEKETKTIVQTLRFKNSTYDKINGLSHKYKKSFNAIANELLEFGLANLNDEDIEYLKQHNN